MDRRNQWFSCLTNTIIISQRKSRRKQKNLEENKKKQEKYNSSCIIFFYYKFISYRVSNDTTLFVCLSFFTFLHASG